MLCFTHFHPTGKTFGSWGIHKNLLDNAKFCEWWRQDNCFFKRQGLIKFVCKYYYFVLFVALLPAHCRCCGLLSHMITHNGTHTHIQSVGFLWSRDRSVAENSTWQLTTLKTDSHAPAGFKPAIPKRERAHTFVLDRADTGNGLRSV